MKDMLITKLKNKVNKFEEMCYKCYNKLDILSKLFVKGIIEIMVNSSKRRKMKNACRSSSKEEGLKGVMMKHHFKPWHILQLQLINFGLILLNKIIDNFSIEKSFWSIYFLNLNMYLYFFWTYLILPLVIFLRFWDAFIFTGFYLI